MKLQTHWFRNILFILGAFVIGFFFVFALRADATEITFENCEPGTQVGGVKWEWKDGIRGNYQGSDYTDILELDLKGAGSVIIDLEPGDYAITHYRPVVSGYTEDGQRFFYPAVIKEFREIYVQDSPFTESFGCGG